MRISVSTVQHLVSSVYIAYLSCSYKKNLLHHHIENYTIALPNILKKWKDISIIPLMSLKNLDLYQNDYTRALWSKLKPYNNKTWSMWEMKSFPYKRVLLRWVANFTKIFLINLFNTWRWCAVGWRVSRWICTFRWGQTVDDVRQWMIAGRRR